jgi:threonine dehydrogenase-like Zn-dependent dehydrogenase
MEKISSTPPVIAIEALRYIASNAYYDCSINLGRAPVRAVFMDAFEVLTENKEKLSDFITHRLPILEAARGYELFEKQKARKVVLVV